MKKTIFQFVLLGVFGFAILVAVFIFSGVIKIPGQKGTAAGLSGTVTIWGTLPSTSLAQGVSAINDNVKTYTVKYVEKDRDAFEYDLVQALASQKGPDMIILDPSLILRQGDKLAVTPYTTFSEREYKDTYVDIANLFLTAEGVVAVPISIDPMVLYYNRDILNREGVVTTPQYWNDLQELAPIFSEVTNDGVLLKNMIGLGEYDNVTHAKDIISMLALQLGNPIVQKSVTLQNKEYVTKYEVTLNSTNEQGILVGDSVMRFYTQFSDPAKSTYSWNKTSPESRQQFIAGKIPFYFGYASERTAIAEKNPNLSFDLARVPQVKDYPNKTTIGTVLGLAVLNSSKNKAAALQTNQYLISSEYAAYIAEALGTAPARRDLLAVKQTDPYRDIIYPSAVIAKSWYDPDSLKTDQIFKRMSNNIVSGRSTISAAVQDFVNSLQDMLP
jgi:ABC-type glycerol-3-phosphate transport system substrate-binding protein